MDAKQKQPIIGFSKDGEAIIGGIHATSKLGKHKVFLPQESDVLQVNFTKPHSGICITLQPVSAAGFPPARERRSSVIRETTLIVIPETNSPVIPEIAQAIIRDPAHGC